MVDFYTISPKELFEIARGKDHQPEIWKELDLRDLLQLEQERFKNLKIVKNMPLKGKPMTPEELISMTPKERAALSLVDCADNTNCRCTDCTDCEDCTRCTDCTVCTGCVDCTGCMDCTGCTDCVRCTNCIHCTDCIDCTGCVDCIACYIDCKGCKDCTHCTRCTDCVDCTVCTDCAGIKNGKGLQYVAWGIQLTEEQYRSL